MKSFLQIILLLTPFVFSACQDEPWRMPRERFETFSKHLSKREINDALVFIDPEDRKIFEENYSEIPEAFREGVDVFFVGSVTSPRMIRRIELTLPREEPKAGTKLELILHYLNDDKKTAHLVWRDQWYVDLIR